VPALHVFDAEGSADESSLPVWILGAPFVALLIHRAVSKDLALREGICPVPCLDPDRRPIHLPLFGTDTSGRWPAMRGALAGAILLIHVIS